MQIIIISNNTPIQKHIQKKKTHTFAHTHLFLNSVAEIHYDHTPSTHSRLFLRSRLTIPPFQLFFKIQIVEPSREFRCIPTSFHHMFMIHPPFPTWESAAILPQFEKETGRKKERKNTTSTQTQPPCKHHSPLRVSPSLSI